MRVGVVGSRAFPELEAAEEWLRSWLRGHVSLWANRVTVVSGGGGAVDKMAERVVAAIADPYCTMLVHPAEWRTHGASAGMMRNTLIVRDSDFVIAFWDGKSRGTLDTIAKTAQARKPVMINPHKERAPR